MSLWDGRFRENLDGNAFVLNASIAFDKRLAQQDVKGSIAWAAALARAGVLTKDESKRIISGLEAVGLEFEKGLFALSASDEDIHTAVERRLGELIGSLSGKLHTGRSRNDQVATDFRLWMMESQPELIGAIKGLQATLVMLAEDNLSTLMPGYTHLQRAQPVTLAHWFLSHFWALQRDRERLADLHQRVAIMPLGCGALAGTGFPIDRQALAKELGFEAPAPNSMDAISDRDFAAEFLFCTAMIGVHLSKLAENIVLFTTAEFGFFELSDAYSTGSSLMPQKKNPDLFELARGKAGTLIGLLAGAVATLKGLPSTYDKDLQEDKVPVFQAFDTLTTIMPVLARALETMTINDERMLAAIDPGMMATDLADYLVRKGIPFREAHNLVGNAVRVAAEKDLSLKDLPLDAYRLLQTGESNSEKEWQAEDVFEADLYQIFDPIKSIETKNAIGGTSPQSVKKQIKRAKSILKGE